MYNSICKELLDTATLQMSRHEQLEVVLANSEKVNTQRVFYVPVKFRQGVYHAIKLSLYKN